MNQLCRDGHSLAFSVGERLIHLLDPLLGSRIEHAFAAGTTRADLLAAEQRNQFVGTKVTGCTPVREAETVNCGVESAVGAGFGILACAVGNGKAVGKFDSPDITEFRLIR